MILYIYFNLNFKANSIKPTLKLFLQKGSNLLENKVNKTIKKKKVFMQKVHDFNLINLANNVYKLQGK